MTYEKMNYRQVGTYILEILLMKKKKKKKLDCTYSSYINETLSLLPEKKESFIKIAVFEN